MSKTPDPSKILNTGFSFWNAKVLLTAIELDVFSTLNGNAQTSAQLGQTLGLHPRGTHDFFDSLVALGFLHREGSGVNAIYANTEETGLFLDKKSPAYVGGILEMCNDRLYKFWGDLGPALKTGQAQNELKHSQQPLFETIYADPARLEQFLAAMAGISRGNFMALAENFDFSKHRTLCDVGGASGALAMCVAQKHPHLQCTSFDLPEVEPIAQRTIAREALSDRVRTAAGSFLTDALPKADVITMGMILHDWNLETKKRLIRLAYEALPVGGAFIAVENIIDDERRHNAFGLMMSLNMLIETGDGFDFTGADFWGWCEAAGFKRYEIMHLNGPCSAAIAYK